MHSVIAQESSVHPAKSNLSHPLLFLRWGINQKYSYPGCNVDSRRPVLLLIHLLATGSVCCLQSQSLDLDIANWPGQALSFCCHIDVSMSLIGSISAKSSEGISIEKSSLKFSRIRVNIPALFHPWTSLTKMSKRYLCFPFPSSPVCHTGRQIPDNDLSMPATTEWNMACGTLGASSLWLLFRWHTGVYLSQMLVARFSNKTAFNVTGWWTGSSSRADWS